jgi:hypothetical protein
VNYAVGIGTSAAAPAVVGTIAPRIALGACAAMTPAPIMQTLIGEAKSNNAKHSSYAFPPTRCGRSTA